MKHLRHVLFGFFCLTSTLASAQWQWIDKEGRTVFSDRAPSADIAEKNITKRPSGRTANPSNPVSPPAHIDASATPRPPSAGALPQLSGVDKDLAEKKQKAEDAEAAKHSAEEEKIAKAKVENCARAKQAKASFDSGVRIARTNSKGEREVLDDAGRAVEIKRIQSILDSECK